MAAQHSKADSVRAPIRWARSEILLSLGWEVPIDPELRKISRTMFVQRDAIGVTQMIVWTARKPFIDKNRAAMVDFMEDSLRIVRWYLDPANHREAMEIAARVTKQPAQQFDWLFTKQDTYHDPNLIPTSPRSSAMST